MPQPFTQARYIIHHVHGCAGVGTKGTITSLRAISAPQRATWPRCYFLAVFFPNDSDDFPRILRAAGSPPPLLLPAAIEQSNDLLELADNIPAFGKLARAPRHRSHAR